MKIISKKNSKFYLTDLPKQESGFTILELMIASTVFAVILLVVAAGVINFTDTYFKGINSSQTQTVARSVMSQISQSIEFGQVVSQINQSGPQGSLQGICIDSTLYAYKIGKQVTDSSPDPTKHQDYHGLLTATIPQGVTCQAALNSWDIYFRGAGTLSSGVRELLNQHMRLGAFVVTQSGSTNLYTIHLKIIYGDDDLLYKPVTATTNFANEICTGTSGSQFCAVSDLTTVVDQRL